MQNGTLLQPDKPATPIDAMFSRALPYAPAGEVWQTHTTIGGRTWRYVLAVDLRAAFPLARTHLWPPPRADESYMVMGWHSRHECGSWSGAGSGSGCAELWPAQREFFQLRTAPIGDEHGFDLQVIAPIWWGLSGRGVALLGETAKITSVSPQRFAAVAASGGDGDALAVELRGAPGERVGLHFCTFQSRSAPAVRHNMLVEIGLGGRVSVTLPSLQRS